MSDQQQQSSERVPVEQVDQEWEDMLHDEEVAEMQSQLDPTVRVERGAPKVGEMVQTFTVICGDCEKKGITTAFLSQHPIDDPEQVHDMCPVCNARGHRLQRTVTLTRANEFVIETTLTYAGCVVIDNSGFAQRIKPKDTWKIYRVPVRVAKKYGFNVGSHRLGFGPLIVEGKLDSGDRQIKGMAQPADAAKETPVTTTTAIVPVSSSVKWKFEGTAILMVRLLEHGMEVGRIDMTDMPEKAYDDVNKSSHVTKFVYSRVKAGQRGAAYPFG